MLGNKQSRVKVTISWQGLFTLALFITSMFTTGVNTNINMLLK